MTEFGTMDDFDKMLDEIHKRGMKLIMEGITSLVSGEGKNSLINTIVSKTNSEYIMYKIKSAIEPRVRGKLK